VRLSRSRIFSPRLWRNLYVHSYHIMPSCRDAFLLLWMTYATAKITLFLYNGHSNLGLFLWCSLSLSVRVPPWIMNESHSFHHHPLLCDTKWLYPSNVFLKFMQIFLSIGEVQESKILIYKVWKLLSIIGSRDWSVVSNFLNRKPRIVKHILTGIHITHMC
jgi:hypothetical protein